MGPSESWQDRWYDRFYDRSRGWVDGTTEFHQLCRSLLTKPKASILEIGAGPDNATSQFLTTLGEVHGLDPDPDVRSNRSLKSAAVLDGDTFPYADESFDLCVSNFVVEHVANPSEHLAEIYRVLRPGGSYVFRTPNRWHPVFLISSATPHWFHVLVANRVRNLPGDAHDPYPTLYRMNSAKVITQLAKSASFIVETVRLLEKEPAYARASRILFTLFLAYERIVNATSLTANLRGSILAVLTRAA